MEPTQEISNTYKYSTGLRRILASICDFVILLSPIYFITSFSGDGVFTKWFVPLYSIVPVLYFVFGHYLYGHTVGKSVLYLKVVDYKTEGKITLKQSFLREIVWLIFSLLNILIFILNDQFGISLNSFLIELISEHINTYWFLLEFITMVTNRKRRALHDFIGGTVVIKTQ